MASPTSHSTRAAKRARKILADKKRSIAWLADEIGKPYSTVRAQIKRGITSVDNLGLIANALEVSPAELVG